MPFSGQEMTDKKVVAWKFNQLDKDRDRHLKRREVRNLRRMLKKLVRPKACAKTFVTYCDSNRDKKISTTEWKLCLRVDPRSKSGFRVGSLLFSVNCQDFSLHRAYARHLALSYTHRVSNVLRCVICQGRVQDF